MERKRSLSIQSVKKCNAYSIKSIFPVAMISLLAFFIAAPSSAQPNFELAGFATQNGGTKGGKGGQTVSASTYSQLRSYAESTSPYLIMVQGTISNGSGGGQIRVKSDKSIIGVGSAALLSGVGITISNQNNVIIRNLKITLVGTSTPGSVNGGDCISISGTSKNIWIDHCEIYSEDPDNQTDKDKYDGLIDIKQQTGFITLSWNYLHDHHKGGLVGAADDDLYADRKVTMHHNYYNKVLLRIPMYRGATGHFFNNYIVGAKDATEIQAGTCLRVEKNYYEALHYSIYTPTDAPGETERIDNIEIDRTSRAYPSECMATIPYSYSAVLTDSTAEVKTVVPQYAGVGKIDNVSVRGGEKIRSAAASFCYRFSRKTLRIRANASRCLTVTIFAPDGRKIRVKKFNPASDIGNAELSLDGISNGMYIVNGEIDRSVIAGCLYIP
ncbi:MAG: hypothetical protein JXA18_17625 [Chitinispirillaceae bacterium]|nr:hypothetical protein [Chitinispirillaceae bacterium]